MHFTKREVVGIFLVLFLFLLSLGMWMEFTASVLGAGGYASLSAFIWTSVLSAVFFLGAVVWANRFFRIAGALAVFVPGLFFVPTLYQAVFVVMAAGFAWRGAYDISYEIEDRVRFHFYRSVRAGQLMFVFSLALAMSSGFFSLQKDATWEGLISNLRIGEGTSSVIMKAAGVFYPELRGSGDGPMTVDRFLLSMQDGRDQASLTETIAASGIASLPNALIESITNDSQTVYLRSGREQLSKLVGRPVRGDERIDDVFSDALKGRVVSALSGIAPAQHDMPRFVPFILSVLLFLMLLPFGSSIAIIWIFIAWLFFEVCLMARLLHLETAHREQETLAE